MVGWLGYIHHNNACALLFREEVPRELRIFRLFLCREIGLGLNAACSLPEANSTVTVRFRKSPRAWPWPVANRSDSANGTRQPVACEGSLCTLSVSVPVPLSIPKREGACRPPLAAIQSLSSGQCAREPGVSSSSSTLMDRPCSADTACLYRRGHLGKPLGQLN